MNNKLNNSKQSSGPLTGSTPKKTKEVRPDDGHLDSTLRPKDWADYIGQVGVKENFRILAQDTKV